ncbi:alpha/beta fold hydrolase [Nocardia cyriacigeorgica]|uniref:alpha/beta fold hydrolase n=1 Tax=Nocardia cyriacigeorgica TaxID=135487 RepID=UPI0013D5CD29|nr:alpha/beta hydrolase [Nocardia cyriacigeorgica]NEW27098.1 alpha/beta hydrolase [Nocardia cyriacigeorgica]
MIPGWFADAVATVPERHDIDLDGVGIHVRTWGDPAALPVVLVHGGGAHSGWWNHIAPYLTGTHYVIAPDLSGHGDSDVRDSYAVQTWASEVFAVAQAMSGPRRPTIVGHSLGGWIAAAAARSFADRIDSVLIIDSPPWDEVPENERIQNRNHKRYGSKAEIVRRFAPFPAQRTVLPYVAEHIAAESVEPIGGEWTWKFDPAAFGDHLRDPMPSAAFDRLEPLPTRLTDRMGYVRCEKGQASAPMAGRLRSVLGMNGPYVELVDAGHHPMLDQPLPLIAALRAVLDSWSRTRPQGGESTA